MRILLSVFLIIFSMNISAQDLMPYILAAKSDADLGEIIETVKSGLTSAGLDVIGEYSPAEDNNRKVIVVTSNELQDAVKSIGGLTGFASALRVGITQEEGLVDITYTNPIYIGNAYFRNDFEQVENQYNSIADKLESAFSSIGESRNIPFGSEKGISIKSLRKYRYMIGMQRFDDVAELNVFDSFEDAVATIDGNLSPDQLVYSVEYPDQKLKLYGIAVGGEKGEYHFLPIIDITTPKHTAFLPYELLVMDKKVVMLHGRFRIALSFPDLTMMTFSKIMSTPGDIKKYMKGFTQ